MALVKIQIWSPDQLDSFGGFQPFGTIETNDKRTGSDVGFQVSPEFLNDLMVDPHVKRHVESMIEERTRKAVLKVLAKYDWMQDKPLQQTDIEALSLAELQEELQRLEEGLASRWKEQLSEIEKKKSASEKAWEILLKEWDSQRETLLRSHEREWCETLGYVIQKTQMVNSKKTLEDLEKWMKQNVSELLEKDRITIYLSSEDYAVLNQKESSEHAPKKWILMEDPSLGRGQMRFEVGNAGIIFDEKKNLEKVLGWID